MPESGGAAAGGTADRYPGRMETPAGPITPEEFARIDVRAGTVLEADPLPDARRPALRLRIDFGPGLGVLAAPERAVPDGSRLY